MVNEGSAANRQYPVRCPACGTLAGYPTSVETVRSKPGHLRIDVSCHACQAQWFQEVDTEHQ